MLTLPTSVRILIATEPADLRKGIDELCRIVEAELRDDVHSGALFVFGIFQVLTRGDTYLHPMPIKSPNRMRLDPTKTVSDFPGAIQNAA